MGYTIPTEKQKETAIQCGKLKSELDEERAEHNKLKQQVGAYI